MVINFFVPFLSEIQCSAEFNSIINYCLLKELMDSERTTHRQLIDEEKTFHREAIQAASKNLEKVDKQYYSVAIIGVQNSGKSTLLNHLFGTNFDVLKQMAGSRTTRGILASVDKAESIIVLDVEGNDAMDRSQDQDYEKMVATYALVTANVLIINIWSKSLGQYTGSQYQTLKVIMDICLEQFKQDSPKTILYCVRDFNEENDDEGEIRRKIVRDVNQIWRNIEKSEEMRVYDNKPEKFFTVEVAVISRYRDGKVGKFNTDVENLRQRFVNPQTDGYIFAKQKIQYNLPIQDLPQLCQNAWTSIKTNNKLNLPSEKEQLANFRCSTILSEISSDFEKQIKQLEDKQLITDYGQLKQKYLNVYDSKTYHYGKDVAEVVKEQLVIDIDDDLKRIVNEHTNLKSNQLMASFTKQAQNLNKESTQRSLDDQLKGLIDYHIEQFINFMKNLGYEVTNRKERIEELSNKLNFKFSSIKQTILQLSREEFENQSSRNIRLLASEVLKNSVGESFWTEAMTAFYSKIEQIVDKFRGRYIWITGDELNPSEYDFLEQKISAEYKQFIKSELQKTLANRMFDHFNKLFMYEEDGDTINFNLKTEEQIGQHFDITRDKIILLIRKLNDCNGSNAPRRSSLIQGMDDDHSLFESTWLSNTTEQIDKNMRNQYEKAIRRKKEGEMNTVPWWLYLIILYFVYDDLWFSESQNPIIHYIMVTIILIPTFLFVIGQGNIVQEFIRIVMEKLKDRFAFLR